MALTYEGVIMRLTDDDGAYRREGKMFVKAKTTEHHRRMDDSQEILTICFFLGCHCRSSLQYLANPW